MLEQFLFIGLPSLALIVLVVGSIVRFRMNRFSYSALSSQFLERRRLLWGSPPFHIGLLILLVGHLIPFLAPGLWQDLTFIPGFVPVVETVGVAAALLALAGLGVLGWRRMFSARIQRVTSIMDLVIVALLAFQIVLGLAVALMHPWGSQWAGGTLTPYLRGLLTLHPDLGTITGMPPLVKLHIIFAFVIVALLPFSRLVHVFSLPLQYLWRPPQKVVWTNRRRTEAMPALVVEAANSRRLFLRGAGASATAGLLLGAGVTDKLVQFFRGPRMTHEEEVSLLRRKLDRLEMTADERQLELERLREPYIFVAQLAELNRTSGKYFIDYAMRPALAFLNEAGLPQLISAKCTHLGCTVAGEADPQGRILCPCHISYFNIQTGEPSAGSPAKAPLPVLGWVLMTPQGEVLARQAPGTGAAPDRIPDAAQLAGAAVYIAKEFSGEEQA